MRKLYALMKDGKYVKSHQANGFVLVEPAAVFPKWRDRDCLDRFAERHAEDGLEVVCVEPVGAAAPSPRKGFFEDDGEDDDDVPAPPKPRRRFEEVEDEDRPRPPRAVGRRVWDEDD